MSTLATVVGSDQQDIADWKSRKIRLNHPFAKFHAKFWGVVDSEEKTGLTPLSDNMEVDDSTADGNGDEINPHCYVLEIDIPGVEDKIWVRADYIRMFEYAEGFYDKSLPSPLSPCLVITGQPGVGEFCCCY